MHRRRFLGGTCGLVLGALFPSACGAQRGPRAAPEARFDFEALRERARALARRPPRPAPAVPAGVHEIDYDAHQGIRFREEAALFADRPPTPPIQLFHVGRHNPLPVRVHTLEGGRAREVRYSPSLFAYEDASLGRRLPPGLGFGGFRAMHGGGERRDWLAFAGASYFRSSGELDQYGLSARGVAIGTGLPEPEEFPRFSEFWLEPSSAPDVHLTVYALLEGPSLTGAYRFRCRREGAVVMDTEAFLYPRGPIARLGIAPLTSMFWFSETNRHRATDWRPEVHDSDGLAMWTGAGERLFRPLRNPSAVRVHAYQDRNPRGFGLVQRDRAFDHYQDDGVFYERRPTAWVEPIGAWGEGEVMLVEIPTDDEIFDNIVAFWRPHREVRAGDELRYAYRLHWVADEPSFPASLARVVATRMGRAGVPGRPRPVDGVKIVLDLEGGALATLSRGSGVEPVVSASRGRVDNVHAWPIVGTSRWRATFDVTADGDEPVELRCYLRRGRDALSETWIYPLVPFRFGT
ncbi:MAG TPA: glucan biosynthesis protein [Sandaracinaceae bacterium]